MRVKSNIILSTIFTSLMLTGCMEDYAQRDYTPTETGYETAVVQNINKEAAQKIAANGAENPANVPVQVNNPYALATSNQGSNVPVINNNTYNAPVIPYGVISNNNAYGTLNKNVIQTGVFMPSQAAPRYSAPAYGGGNYQYPNSEY